MTDSKSCLGRFTAFFRNVPARVVLYFLNFSCVIVLHFLRTAITFTILAMVKESNDDDQSQSAAETLCGSSDNHTVTTTNYGGTLEWSIDEQYYAVTSFFWTYTIAQVFGGAWGHKFGAKIVVGFGVASSVVCTLCIPLASNFGYIVVTILQLCNGFAQGLCWPALYTLVNWWIPIEEKSRYVSSFHGHSIGTTMLQVSAGFVISSVGWEYVFYLTGSIGIIWCLGWYLLAFNKPELHPRISLSELNYIKLNREKSLGISKQKVPWISILCSLPMWAIAISASGRSWISSIVYIYGPLYLKSVIGLKVEMNGLTSGLVSFGTFLSSILFSYISDKLIITNVTSIAVNRKLFTALGQVFPGALCVLIGYLHCNLNLIFAIWASIQILLSANFIGTMVNIVDITPNFAGPVTSLVQTVLMSATIFSSLAAKTFLQEGSNLESWRGIFNFSAGICFASYLFYFLFASAEVQEWDKEKAAKKEEECELKILNS